MYRFFRKVLHPGRYHGKLRHQEPPFFEGWYFKLIDATGAARLAIIPGVFWSSDPHAFVQVLDGSSGLATYHRFPTEMFWAAEDRFEVHVGANRFTSQGLTLLLEDSQRAINGQVQFGAIHPWPVTLASPGIMGWYGWLPFMECYHGVLSLDHTLHGAMNVDGRRLDFAGGRGYLEKDWGRSFPESYIWFQTNHFSTPGTSLTGSVAIIPWGRRAFRGFIVGLWHRKTLYRFTTYNSAESEQLDVTDETVHWVLRQGPLRLELRLRRGQGTSYGILKGPTVVEMGKRVDETLSATIDVRLTTLEGGREHVLFEDTGHHAGLETFNVQERLLEMQER